MAHVWLIQDDSGLADHLARLLGFAAHEVTLWAEGTEALNALERGVLPEGILISLLGAGLDGLQFCRRLKQTPAWASIPVLLLSEKGEDPQADTLARRAGASALLRLPLQRDLLLAELDRALMMAPLQTNPLAQKSPTEELAFWRDYAVWLSRRLYQSEQKARAATEEAELYQAHLMSIDSVTTILGETLNLGETGRKLVSKTADLLRADAALLYLREDENTFRLMEALAVGVPTPRPAPLHHVDETSPLLGLYREGGALRFDDEASLGSLRAALGLEQHFRSALASPLLMPNGMGGLMLVLRVDADDPFSPQDAKMLFSLAGAAGLALRSAQLFTDLETAYSDLQELDRRKSEFVAITSHELRTPIAIMLGYAAMLRDLEADDTKRGLLSTIEKQANFLTSLVDTLLNLHQLKASDDAVHLRCSRFRVDSMLKEAIEITQRHNTHQKEVRFSLDCDPVEIKGDEMRLLLAFNNLLDNAIKFSEPESEVKVWGAERLEGGLIITIQDQGCGIAPENHERIFEPFFQVEDAMTRRHGGLGLGLAIVKGMVELHGGSVEVKSRLNEGARFIVTLPAAPPDERCFSPF